EGAIVPHRQTHGLRVEVLVRPAVELVPQRLTTLAEMPEQFADGCVGLLGRARWGIQRPALGGLPPPGVRPARAATKALEVPPCRARLPWQGGTRTRPRILVGRHRRLLACGRLRPGSLPLWQGGCSGGGTLRVLGWRATFLVLDALRVVSLVVLFLR